MDIATVFTAVMRAVHLLTTLSLIGTVGFLTWVLPAANQMPNRVCHSLLRVWWVSGAISLVSGVIWFILQSGAIAGAHTVSEVMSSLPTVARHTRYGHLMLIRLGLVLTATSLAFARMALHEAKPQQAWLVSKGRLKFLYAMLTMLLLAVALQGAIGHAGAAVAGIQVRLITSEFLHLCAAGLWLGGLLPLWIVLLWAPTSCAAQICERFSPIALGCVAILGGTSFAQGSAFIGSLSALMGTVYGHLALLKILLFITALVMAAFNRLWLTDRLATGSTDARQHLLLTVGIETLIGITIVSVAAFLASAVPGVHETPTSPFF